MTYLARFKFYLFSLFAVSVSTVAYLVITKLTGHPLPAFITFYPAVLIIALAGGFWPGIFTTVISIILADYFVFQPQWGFKLFDPTDIVAMILFFIMGLLICIVAHRYRRLRFKLESIVVDRTSELTIANQQLSQEIDARQQSQQSLQKLNAELEQRVAQQVFEIKKANENLEKRIVERTIELQAANISLRKSQQAALNLMEDAIQASKQEQKAKEIIRQSQQDLSRAQAVGHVGNWRLDVRKNELTWSDENHHIFGIPKGDVMTYQTFLSCIHPDDRQYVDDQWNAALAGEPYDIEHRIIVDGNIKWVREKADLEFDENRQLIGGFGITQDITERKQMLGELQKAKDQLEQRVIERTADLDRTISALKEEAKQRIAAEEKVKAERKQFEDVLDMLPAYAVLLTADYQVAYANKTFRQWFGDDNGRKCYEFLFGRTEPCDNCQTYNVLKTGREQFWEWTGPNGKNYDIYDYPFIDSDGRPLIMEIGVDVTAHKQAQIALLHGEERYRSLVVATTQIVWTTDAQGQVVDDMPSWRAFTGQTLEEIQGWGWINSLHPDDRQQTAKIWSLSVENKSLYDTGYRIRRRDGQYRYVSVRGVPIIEPDGHISEWVGTCTDITEKKQLEDELLANSLYTRSLLEASLDPLVTINIEGKITDVNEAAVKVTGVSRRQLIGTDFSSYFTEPLKAQEGYRRVFAKDYVTDYPLTIRHKDGHLTDVLYNATVYKDPHSKVIGVFAAARDVTEKNAVEADLEKYRLHLEDMVKQRTEELARSNKDLEQFAYVASHDLQEPLRAISGFVSLLRIQLRDMLDAKKMEYMNFTTDGVERMQALINGLLEYSRIGSSNKKPELVDAKEALDNALANLSRSIRESGTKIFADNLPKVYVNPMQLAQLFQNLIANAIKFCDKQFPQIGISAVRENSSWLFAVSDNGIGIEPQYAERIFQIFQRLHGREKYSGTGIGLSICKRIVEHHGGKIWVESNPEKGSTFYFTIPDKGVNN